MFPAQAELYRVRSGCHYNMLEELFPGSRPRAAKKIVARAEKGAAHTSKSTKKRDGAKKLNWLFGVSRGAQNWTSAVQHSSGSV